MKHIINIIGAIGFIFCANCVTALLEFLSSNNGLKDIPFVLWIIFLPVIIYMFYCLSIKDKAIFMMLVILLTCMIKLFKPLPIENNWDWLLHQLPLWMINCILLSYTDLMYNLQPPKKLEKKNELN